MARSKNSAQARRKAASKPFVRRADPMAATVRDPVFEKRITKMVAQFMGRSLLITAVILAVGEFAISRARIPDKQLAPFLGLITFAIVLPFVRGAARVFALLKQIGKERLEQKRYADALFALEYFHRFGQMSFDPNGEAHFYLTRAYLGMGDYDQARRMAEWMGRYRRRFEWAAKAKSAVEAAEKARVRAETASGTDTS